MPGVPELWYRIYLGNPLGAWALALATFLITFTLLPLAQRYITARRARLGPLGSSRAYHVIDLAAFLVERTNRLFLWGVAAFVTGKTLSDFLSTVVSK